MRGADARVLFCDAATKYCEAYPELLADIAPVIKPMKMFPCDWCQTHIKHIPPQLELPVFYLSNYVRESEYLQALTTVADLTLPEIINFHHKGLNLGEHVRTTLHRSFLVGTLTDDQMTRAVGRRLLATAIQLAYGLDRLMEEFDPQVAVINHGIYLTRGTCLEVAKRHGIRVVCWDGVYLYGGIELSHGDTYHHEFRLEPWEAWENLRLTQEQENMLESLLSERRGGTKIREAVAGLPGSRKNIHPPHQTKQRSSSRRNVILFTNISWDGRVKVNSSLYDGPAEWVIETLHHLANRSDLRVIVRIHPNEVKQKPWFEMKQFSEEIREAFPVLPKNVKLILPESPVNSYALAELADVVVVYSTLMGLEALAMGKPVIITGDAYYSNKGFGIQPATRTEYLQVLDHLDEIEPLSQKEQERVRRYAYHFFFRRWLILPIPPRNPEEHWLSEDLRELKPGSSNALDRACEGILHGTPFHVGAP